MSNCACGSNLNFDACCGPVIGGKLAETAEALLRARYTAFAMGNTDFLVETLTHAGRFPLAMVLPTLRQGARARAYGVTASQGTVMALTKRKNVAVQISPTSYVPPEFYCPALAGDGACTIHKDKPSRCRTMPFSP